MKIFDNKKQKVLSVIHNPLTGKYTKKQIVQQSISILAFTNLLKEKKIFRHTKCEKRSNVLSEVDMLISSLLLKDLKEESRNENSCPYLKNDRCQLIESNSPAPVLCCSRIVKENNLPNNINKILKTAYNFLKLIIKLTGTRK
jgi:hypothetical protein